MASVLLTISWKYRPRWPVRQSDLEGYESVVDARRQLSKRRPDRQYKTVPGGFKYEEPFSCRSEKGKLVYTFTETAAAFARR